MPTHLTAMKRSGPSCPAYYLASEGRLRGRKLDYGCGRGFDADHYGMKKYDPHWFPTPPKGLFDTITCTYVLNVVGPAEQRHIVQRIRNLLTPNGRGYIAVRRDFKHNYRTKNATQRRVRLRLPVLHEERGAFCIYVVTRIDKSRVRCYRKSTATTAAAEKSGREDND